MLGFVPHPNLHYPFTQTQGGFEKQTASTSESYAESALRVNDWANAAHNSQ